MYGVFKTQQVPSLAKAAQSEIIHLVKLNAAYQESVKDTNTGRPNTEKIKSESICKCTKPKLVHCLCILGRIPSVSKAEETASEAVKE